MSDHVINHILSMSTEDLEKKYQEGLKDGSILVVETTYGSITQLKAPILKKPTQDEDMVAECAKERKTDGNNMIKEMNKMIKL